MFEEEVTDGDDNSFDENDEVLDNLEAELKMHNAVLVGLGGIGYNVYPAQLKRIGCNVVTVDKYNSPTNPDYEDLDDAISNNDFEYAVICINYNYMEQLELLGEAGVKYILVESLGYLVQMIGKI